MVAIKKATIALTLALCALTTSALAAPVALTPVHFKDLDQAPRYLVEAVDAGFVSGSGDGYFHPYRTVTKAEFAWILYRAFGDGSADPADWASAGPAWVEQELIGTPTGLDWSGELHYHLATQLLYLVGVKNGHGEMSGVNTAATWAADLGYGETRYAKVRQDTGLVTVDPELYRLEAVELLVGLHFFVKPGDNGFPLETAEATLYRGTVAPPPKDPAPVRRPER